MSVWPYIAIIGLIILSALFSGAETVFATANGVRLKNNAKSGKKRDTLAIYVYERYENALVAILIGNNIVNIAASSLGTVIALELMGDAGAWVSTAVMTALILVFGEIMPKLLAVQNADAAARWYALPIKLLMLLFYPAIALVRGMIKLFSRSRLWANSENSGPAVTEDDLEVMIDAAEDEGILDEEKSDLLQSALEFDDVQAYEIITPRVDMLAIDINDDYEDVIETLMASPYSRIPVYEDTVDNIIGILHLNHVFKQLVDDEEIYLHELLMEVCFVHKTMPLPDVLTVMKQKQNHMVIVTDEYGGTMGLLTMEDVLEQLVGEIWDESDQIEEEFKKVGRDLYEVSGDMRTEDLFDELDIEDSDFDDDNATVGGWAIEMLGGYPKQGDTFTYKNIQVTVKKRRNLRVIKLAVLVLPEAEEAE